MTKTITDRVRNLLRQPLVYRDGVPDRPHVQEPGPVNDNIEILWRKNTDLRKALADILDSLFDVDDSLNTVYGDVTRINNSVINIVNNNLNEKRFSGYNEAGGDNIAGTFIDLPITDEQRKDVEFIHAPASYEVEINETNEYEIIAEAGFNLNIGDVIELSLEYDDGTGYAPVVGARAYCGL